MNVGLRKLKFVDPQYVSTQKYNNRADLGDRVSEILTNEKNPRPKDRGFLCLIGGDKKEGGFNWQVQRVTCQRILRSGFDNQDTFLADCSICPWPVESPRP